ncbi:MAG: metallophosphoesterase [Desulfuromusa sp.]|nr:metallophosphoesterase [Desulfuromusa sp.]
MEKIKSVLYTHHMVDVKIETTTLSAEDNVEATGPPRSNSFSLAHISDLHLTSLDNIKFSQLFNKRILGYFSWLHKRRIVHRRDIIESLLHDLRITQPDHIAVTGDLTHLGLPMEYAEVSQWLPSLGPPQQVTVIPGNHEAYSGKNWFKSSASWSQYLKSDTCLDSPKTANFFPSLRIRGQVALISLCSARPSLPLLAIGSLGQEQLTVLEDLLQKTGKKGLLRIILIHHPPVSGTIKWRKRLTDSEPFAAVLARQGAELVLHGHAHTPLFSELPTPIGKIPVIGAPSASELNPEAGKCAKYNIYRISQTGMNWQLNISVRGYSESLGRFVPEKEFSLPVPLLQNLTDQ